ncbi:hypothetical protein SK128_013739 [Halocaridina rubra]|uniref:Uncharacterized protein n=1 Tax=Halocaridina rubra TaxID=373956 RepID=A0AAN9A573_HALRR
MGFSFHIYNVVMERANPLIRQALDKEKTVVISGISESQEPTWQGRLEENKANVVDLIRKLGVVCGPEDIVNIHQLEEEVLITSVAWLSQVPAISYRLRARRKSMRHSECLS